MPSSKKKYRESIPKVVKDRLWDTTFGETAGQGKCEVCGIIINSKRFEAGHVISVYNGGDTTIQNLRCICSTCNKSMGTMNLEVFKKRYFPKPFIFKKKSEIKEESEIKSESEIKEENEEKKKEREILRKISELSLFEFKNN